jgi:hypothetical protein
VRKGLDADIGAARIGGYELPAAGIASLRTLADQLDQLERFLRSPDARPYDRIPLTGLARQFDDTYDRVFAAVRAQADPIGRALAAFLEHEQPAGPASGDAAVAGPDQ